MVEENPRIALWTKYHAWAMLSAALVFVMSHSSLLFLGIALTSFLAYTLSSRKVWQQFGWWGGTANVITTLRLGLIGWVVWQNQTLHPYLIFVVGIFTLIADGLDGYYARKYHTVSSFGDCFDKETDAFFVLAYGVIISQRGLAGDWVLLPGLLRYVYVMLLSFVEVKLASSNSSFRRQFIGMWLMGTLLAPFVISPVVYIPGLVFAIAMIMYSFGKDLKEVLLQQREKAVH